MSKEQDRAESVLDELLECEDGLSAKELDFIESMDKKRQFEWSDKQIAWLDGIYKKVID